MSKCVWYTYSIVHTGAVTILRVLVSWLLWEITFPTVLGKELLPSWEAHRVPPLTLTVTSWEFFRRHSQGSSGWQQPGRRESKCPCVTLHGPVESSAEIAPVCMCFSPALFLCYLTSSQPQETAPTVSVDGNLGQWYGQWLAAGATALWQWGRRPPCSSWCCGVPWAGRGALRLYWRVETDKWRAPTHLLGGQGTVLTAPAVTGSPVVGSQCSPTGDSQVRGCLS